MPVTLEPPRQRKNPSTTYANSQPRLNQRPLMERLSRPIFFVGAILLHLLVFLLVASRIMFQPTAQKPDEPFILSHVRLQPPPPLATPVDDTPMPRASSSFIAPSRIFTSPRASTDPFLPPLPDLTGTSMIKGSPTTSRGGQAQSGEAAREAHVAGLKDTVLNKWNEPLPDVQENPGDPTTRVAKFSVYLASYADGDWNCNVTLDAKGQIVAGSLPDLVTKIGQWSHGRLKATLIRTPLSIGSKELLEVMPPFVFFTGHKDFVLTDAEIANLHEYLMRGGAVWGDNALPGLGSRFDVAFLREMKRVISDKGAQFAPVPMDYPIFKSPNFFPMTKLPEGMNFYNEPLQHLDLFGKLAILYSPNDYSDMSFMDILPDDKTVGPTWVYPNATSQLFTSGQFYFNSNLYFRNFTMESSLASQQLGMDIVGYLLVRFDDQLLLAP